MTLNARIASGWILTVLAGSVPAQAGKPERVCEPVRLGAAEVSVATDGDDPELVLRKEGREMGRLPFPGAGPDADCLKLQAFPQAGLILLHYFKGTAGTSILHESESLLVLRPGEQGFEKLREIGLRERERSNSEFKGVRVLEDREYEAREQGKRVEIRLKDRLKGRSTTLLLP